MPRNQHEQQVAMALAQRLVNVENKLLFTLVRTRRDPDQTVAEQPGALLPPRLHDTFIMPQVEFDVAHGFESATFPT